MNVQEKIFALGFNRNQREVDRTLLYEGNGIPHWLNGSFIRNGPGLFYCGEKRFNHWFDGLAMLHKFDFDHGKVYYQSKFLECESSKQALHSDTLTYSEFATDPCWSIFGRLRSMYKHGPTDSAKVNLARVGDKYFALGETTMQIQFDPETLQSVGKYNFKMPKFGTSSTAHPHIENNEACNLVIKYGPINKYQILKMDSSVTKLASVDTFTPCYMHSFGMSKKYFVIAETPYTVQSLNLLLVNRPFIENFKWDKNRGTRLWIIDRKSGKTVLKKEIPPFFYFHFVNCFDIEEGLVFDMITYENADIIESYYLDNIYNKELSIPGGKLTRFEVDLGSKSVDSFTLCDVGMELPTIDYDRYNMNPGYRYVYAMSLNKGSHSFYDQLIKVDTCSKTYVTWFQDGCFPGEPIFIPRPQSHGEDDGILMSLVIDTREDCSFLLILDAVDLSEISRVQTPAPILAGFHCNYFKN